MKLTLIYNNDDLKLKANSYSQAYRDQFLALIKRFDHTQLVTSNCSTNDIDGDIVIFYDPHSCHHVNIEGIENLKAVKYSYMDDPFQPGCTGTHIKTGQIVKKLGANFRIKRARKRFIDFIICPYTESYYRYFGRYLNGDAERMLVWFPVVSDIKRYDRYRPIVERKHEILANGALNHLDGFDGYEFRKWAFKQPEVKFVKHCTYDPTTPGGIEYPKLLFDYAGALALCDTHIPPKYTEIPMAGCVCFAQRQPDYERMGFVDEQNCIYVTRDNFRNKIVDFKNNVADYQKIADAGRKLIESKWTADKFADYVYEHAKKELNEQ